MRNFITFLLAYLAIATAVAQSPLPSNLEKKMGLELAQVEKARVVLMQNTEHFNQAEQALNQLVSLDHNEFEQAVAQLHLLPKDIEDLHAWHEQGDLKKINSFVKTQLLEAYKKTTVPREDWEKLFSQNWSKKEKELLRRWHKDEALVKAQKAYADSNVLGILFSQLKKNPERVKQFCAGLPKGGMLHTHPYGTMDRETVRQVLSTFDPLIDKEIVMKYVHGKVERVGSMEVSFLNAHADYYQMPHHFLEIKSTYPEDAQKIEDFFFMPQDTSHYDGDYTPFSRFLAAFALPLEMLGILTGNTENQLLLEKIIYNNLFLRSLSNHLWYVELTRNLPVLKESRKFSDRYDSLLNWTKESEVTELGAIYPRTLLSFNRTNLDTDERRLYQVTTMSQFLQMNPSPYVVGINLMGDESLVSALDASQLIYGKLLVTNRQRNTGLQATIHAGELGDVRNLREAIVFGVQRIGHGVKLQEEPVYLELARRYHVAIESNLTSNDLLKVVPISTNPFLYFYRLGLPVSLSTDDEGMFETSADRECEKAITQTDIEYVELKGMMKNSLSTSFADQSLKEQLQNQLENDFLKFETQWRLKLAQ